MSAESRRKCVFINLDEATERRARVEAGFAAAPRGSWVLERFSAVRPDPQRLRGSMTPGREGCFLSHLDVLAKELSDDQPLFVVEDDVVFSSEAFSAVDSALAMGDWDILYTDLMVLEFGFLTTLARQRRELVAQNRRVMLNPAGHNFAGSTAYAVRGTSKRKLHDLLAAADLSRPYDLVLFDQIRAGGLKAAFLFPFVTTVDAAGDLSQIDEGDGRDFWRATLNLFRRLMFSARDLAACQREAEALLGGMDREAQVLGAVLAGLMSPRFPTTGGLNATPSPP